jgi:hypothetical protein
MDMVARRGGDGGRGIDAAMATTASGELVCGRERGVGEVNEDDEGRLRWRPYPPAAL